MIASSKQKNYARELERKGDDLVLLVTIRVKKNSTSSIQMENLVKTARKNLSSTTTRMKKTLITRSRPVKKQEISPEPRREIGRIRQRSPSRRP